MDRGKLRLDQPVRFLPSDRILPHTYSPLQDKYPEAGVEVPLRELLRLSVSLSDNAATDVLLRLLGGPQVVEAYMHWIGVAGFQLRDDEAELSRDVRPQYRNWFEPASAVSLLAMLRDHSPLAAASTALLLGWMKDSPTGPGRIRAGVPAGTVVRHKTGTSGVDAGVAHATNDIGLIEMPGGGTLALAVFVTDSTASEAVREGVIARVSAAVYGAAVEALQ